MRLGLFLIVLALPLLEIAVLIKLGHLMGIWPTLLLLLASALAGILVLYRQGRSGLREAADALRQGRPPVEPMADSLLLVLAGALLLAPGVLTDAAGVLLLVSPLRRHLARWAIGRLLAAAEIEVQIDSSNGRHARTGKGNMGHPSRGEGVVIEGEFERIEEPEAAPQQPPRDPKPKSPT